MPAGEVGFVGTIEAAAGDISQALVGQHDETGQIVLEMPKLALVLKQVSENPGTVCDHGSRSDNRQFHHTSSSSWSASSAWLEGTMLALAWQITTAEEVI
jgi:hypothetical protein